MRARAAWAAMLAVSVLVWIERAHAAAINAVELLEWQKPQIQLPVAQVLPIYFEAKFGSMFGGTAEYIIVFDPPPNDPISSPIRVQFNHGDLAHIGEIFGFRSNYSVPNECGIREGESFWKASIEELERGVCPQINRWCLAAIFQDHTKHIGLNRTLRPIVWGTDGQISSSMVSGSRNIPGCNVSTQLLFGIGDSDLIGRDGCIRRLIGGFGRLSRDFDLFCDPLSVFQSIESRARGFGLKMSKLSFASIPKPISGAPKRQSENSNSDGGASDNKGLMQRNPPIKPQKKSVSETLGDAIAFFGTLGGLLLLAAYAKRKIPSCPIKRK